MLDWLAKMCQRVLPWLDIWENKDQVLLERLQAEAIAHTLGHSLIVMAGYFFGGNRGFWVGVGISIFYALYKELITDGHLSRLRDGSEVWGDGNFLDMATDLVFRLGPIPILILLFLVVKVWFK